MNCQQIKKEIEYILGDGIDEEFFINLCNECLGEDLAELLKLETKATITLAADDDAVAFPNDILKVIMLQATGSGRTTPQTLNQVPINDDLSSGYVHFDRTITLRQLNNPPYTLTLWYYRYPATITALTDTPDMPSRFHHALKYYFLAKFYKNEGDAQEAIWWGDYEKIRSMISDGAKKAKGMGKPRRVRVSPWI